MFNDIQCVVSNSGYTEWELVDGNILYYGIFSDYYPTVVYFEATY